MVAQRIERAQEQVDEGFGNRNRAFAHVGKQRLEGVGESLERDVAECARAALDRVDCAEHRVDGIAVLRAGLARGEAAFGRRQRFLALGEEDGLDFLGVHAAPPP